MTTAQRLINLETPHRRVDVVMDSDAFNEIDDQYAIAYMLRSPERICVRGICAAPFQNELSRSPADGMIKSYYEIQKVLKLAGREDLIPQVHKGARRFLLNEMTPEKTEASEFIAALADEYSPEKPLYILSIGAITNVASALLMNPGIKEKIVIIWLAGHGYDMPHTNEFNLRQDVAAARIVFGCGAPLVQLPCLGVVDRFSTSQYELEHWLRGKNALCDYLVDNTITAAERYAAGFPWTRVIWDVTAVAWLLNDDQRFMCDQLRYAPIPEYDLHYAFDNTRHFLKYVTQIHRDELFYDLFTKLAE